MTSQFQEECFSLGEKGDCMLTVTSFQGNPKIHIRQFYVNEMGKRKLKELGLLSLWMSSLQC